MSSLYRAKADAFTLNSSVSPLLPEKPRPMLLSKPSRKLVPNRPGGGTSTSFNLADRGVLAGRSSRAIWLRGMRISPKSAESRRMLVSSCPTMTPRMREPLLVWTTTSGAGSRFGSIAGSLAGSSWAEARLAAVAKAASAISGGVSFIRSILPRRAEDSRKLAGSRQSPATAR